jgi:hypothetical protein
MFYKQRSLKQIYEILPSLQFIKQQLKLWVKQKDRQMFIWNWYNYKTS